MKKRDRHEASSVAVRAAERHERDKDHATMVLYNDNMVAEGMCCHECEWMRFNKNTRSKKQ